MSKLVEIISFLRGQIHLQVLKRNRNLQILRLGSSESLVTDLYSVINTIQNTKPKNGVDLFSFFRMPTGIKIVGLYALVKWGAIDALMLIDSNEINEPWRHDIHKFHVN